MKVKFYYNSTQQIFPSDMHKIDFNDKTDMWNPFADIYFKFEVDVPLPEDLDIDYMNILLQFAIKYGNKSINPYIRVNFVKNLAADDTLFLVDKMDEIGDKLSNVLPYKDSIFNNIKTLLPISAIYSNIFLETIEERNGYRFIHDFQWLVTHRDVGAYGYSKKLIPITNNILKI